MSNYNTAHLDLDDPKDRAKVMGWCRRNAQAALARLHKDEYNVLLRLEYAAAGIEVKQTRLTAEQKRLRKIDRLRAYIFQLGLVELQDQIINGTLDGNEAVVRERMLRGWIDAKVRSLDIDASPALSANALHQAAADLAQRAVRVLRAR